MRPIRLLSRLLGAALVATIAACGGSEEGTDADEGAASAAVPAEERIEAPPEAAGGPGPRKTVEAAIEAARAAGEIDAEAALAARMLALAGDARLPARFRAAAGGRTAVDEVDGNAVIADLRAAWPRLSAPTRQLLAPLMRRPTGPTGWSADATGSAGTSAFETAAAVRPTCAAGAAWAPLDAAVAGVRVWYDPTSAADLAQAQAVVAALDTRIWPALVTTLGFNAPLSDLALDCDGGNARLDVYIVAGFGSRGATYPEAPSPRRSSTFIVLRDGLAGGELQYTVTHQFMHAVMWTYLMAADQESYGWMRNALANWAVEAVYPGNATLLADASCHMNSTFLPITSRATGACSTSTSRSRDYGAYLLYQYIGRTSGNATVRDLLAATTTQTTALAAIDVVVPGGLRALWPRYAKTLWNRLPITATGRPAYFNWDGLATVPQLAPDRPTPVNANLGGVAEASTPLSRSVANVSTRFYRFNLSDTATRSLMFRNTFYPLFQAGTKVSVQALWRTAGGWVEEDWTAKEWIGLCRDVKAQRILELVVIVASGEVGAVAQAVAANPATFRRNNIGCWGYRGTARRTDVYGSWSSGSVTVNSTLLFDYKPNGTGTTQYNDAATGRLRVPIAAPLFRRAAWSLNETYSENGCSYLLAASATDTSIVLGGLGFGSIIINNFAESLPASLRTQQQSVVGTARGAYSMNAATQRFNLSGSVSGPQPECGTTYQSAPGLFTLTNITPATAPVIALDGHLRGTYVSSASPDSVIFTWDLAPQREP